MDDSPFLNIDGTSIAGVPLAGPIELEELACCFQVTSSSREIAAPEPVFQGDPAWSVERELRDGTKITIRPILPSDRDALREGFARTSLRTRYMRFLGATTELSDAALTYLTNVDQERHVALVATVASPDMKSERGVGVARFIQVEDAPNTVEAAITVADDMQNRGVGTALAHELVRAARARNVQFMRAEVLASNDTMRSMLEEAGAHRVQSGEHENGVVYEIELGPPPFLDRVIAIVRSVARTMGDAM